MQIEFDKVVQGLTEPKSVSPFEAEDQELENALSHIWDIAHEFKLDPHPTDFEVVPAHVMYEIGSYGMPGRFSHWSHGRAYRQMKTTYDYGLQKIYELVINSNPSKAYLLENNPPVHNKFVMAHVLGHTDFFKNNHLFVDTRKDMPTGVSLHASRMHEYEEREGSLKVEKVLDAVLAIDEHVNPYEPDRLSKDEELRLWREEGRQKKKRPVEPMGEFDDLFNFGQQETGLEDEIVAIPPAPDRDLLGFIRNHAPYLEDWERDVIDMVRSEALYFYPQMRTKIMNEGWASFWHKRILREMSDRGFLTPEEDEAWWDLHSGVLQPNPTRLNPYYLGMKMFEYLEDVHNGSLSDKEKKWCEQEGMPVYPTYTGDFPNSPGLSAIRDIMETEDDQAFIRNHFDKNVADRMGMYIYEEIEKNDVIYTVIKEKGWQEIRDKLVSSLDNCGNPYITVVDGDYEKRKELYLMHVYEGVELDGNYVTKTLPYIHHLWRRPVHLETVIDNHKKRFMYDGEKVETYKVEG